ncbi:MAG: HAD-IA family hydrolase [Mariprofundales bacterium]|nr:HAD-IA family hydrolase [Mariprofundales bacterium]
MLLDLDGTLINAFEPIIYALNATLAELSLPQMTRDEIIRHTGRGECSMISLFGDHREQAHQRFLQFHDERLFDIAALPGAESLLTTLQQSAIPVAVVTSKGQARAEQQIAHLGWSTLLPVIVGLTPQRRQKPDPHTLQIACDTLDVAPDEAVMVGDGVADMKAAVRIGSFPLGMTGGFDADALIAAGASATVANADQAWHWLAPHLAQ